MLQCIITIIVILSVLVPCVRFVDKLHCVLLYSCAEVMTRIQCILKLNSLYRTGSSNALEIWILYTKT